MQGKLVEQNQLPFRWKAVRVIDKRKFNILGGQYVYNQISVFIENKPGNLAKFTNFLADNHVDMRAFEIADSSDFRYY